MSDKELLEEVMKNNTFLGEEYMWNGRERVVRNSVKTIAKLQLPLEATSYTNRSFVSLISLIMYAMHITRYNSARTFQLMRAYRAIYTNVSKGEDWDENLRYLNPVIEDQMKTLGSTLIQNKWQQITDITKVTYNNSDYDLVVYVDASLAGWGAIVSNVKKGTTATYQQRWLNTLEIWYGKLQVEKEKMFNTQQNMNNQGNTTLEYGHFMAKFSTHAEPRAVQVLLERLMWEGLPDDTRIAIVTDHEAIEKAQRKLNGYGGIGRDYLLNRLYKKVYDLEYKNKIDITFFYIPGRLNPADNLSRNLGGGNDANIIKKLANNTKLFSFRTHCTLCEEYSNTLRIAIQRQRTK